MVDQWKGDGGRVEHLIIVEKWNRDGRTVDHLIVEQWTKDGKTVEERW